MKKRYDRLNQLSFSSAERSTDNRVARRGKFLDHNEQGHSLRPARGVDRAALTERRTHEAPVAKTRSLMLRMYFPQKFFARSDEALEDSIYDRWSKRESLSIDFPRQDVPDATTHLTFRRMLKSTNSR